MQIENGLVKGIRWAKAHVCGGIITPRYIVVHDTAGRLRKFSSVEWFASAKCTTSAHFVVERDGTITQMVPTDRRAHHAGDSSYKGIYGLNSCSIGIEIVNPGKLNDKGVAWFGPVDLQGGEDIRRESTSAHGTGYWMEYTPEQIEAVTKLCRALVDEYPDCNEIITHWQIAPKRKIDTNPLFPLEDVRKGVFSPPVDEPEPVAPIADAPVVTKGPSLASVAMTSRTTKTLIGAFLTWVTTQIKELYEAVIGAIGAGIDGVVSGVQWGVALVVAVKEDVDAAIAPLRGLADLVKANLPVIIPAVASVLIIVAIARHLRDKKELVTLRKSLPDGGQK